jgi:hypothetical protein
MISTGTFPYGDCAPALQIFMYCLEAPIISPRASHCIPTVTAALRALRSCPKVAEQVILIVIASVRQNPIALTLVTVKSPIYVLVLTAVVIPANKGNYSGFLRIVVFVRPGSPLLFTTLSDGFFWK